MMTEAQVYSQIANRLAELIDDVYEVGIDRDERRELLLNSHWSRRYIPSGAGAMTEPCAFGFGGS